MTRLMEIFKNLPRKTVSLKVLRHNQFDIAEIHDTIDINEELLYWFTKSSGGGVTRAQSIKSEIMSNRQLAEELHKKIIRKVEKQKVYSSFTVYIWGADLADKQLMSKFNKGTRFSTFLCTNTYVQIYVFTYKYAWVVPLKDKKGVAITNASQKVLDESRHKRKKTWMDKGS